MIRFAQGTSHLVRDEGVAGSSLLARADEVIE
jgi:hypothetical protein